MTIQNIRALCLISDDVLIQVLEAEAREWDGVGVECIEFADWAVEDDTMERIELWPVVLNFFTPTGALPGYQNIFKTIRHFHHILHVQVWFQKVQLEFTCIDLCRVLVAARGVTGELSNHCKNFMFPLGPAGISNKSDPNPKNCSKRKNNAINDYTYNHQKAQFGSWVGSENS